MAKYSSTSKALSGLSSHRASSMAFSRAYLHEQEVLCDAVTAQCDSVTVSRMLFLCFACPHTHIHTHTLSLSLLV
jgi:hypothetical protein